VRRGRDPEDVTGVLDQHVLEPASRPHQRQAALAGSAHHVPHGALVAVGRTGADHDAVGAPGRVFEAAGIRGTDAQLEPGAQRRRRVRQRIDRRPVVAGGRR
jgi:hypothetical protein